MDEIENVLLECVSRGVMLSAVNAELHVRCSSGEPDARLVTLLRTHKSALLRYLQAHQSGADKRRIPRVPHHQRGTIAASPAQQRIWFVERLAPQLALYNMPGVYRLRGKLCLPSLERALNGILQRHESLRTRFVNLEDVLLQIVADPSPVPWRTVDLRGAGAAAQQSQLQSILADEAARKFDLAAGPLLRALLITLADDDAVLAITVHHIAADGWSLGILKQELGELYAGIAEPQPLTETPVQYLDFSDWQRGDLAAGRLARELDYWRTQLQGAPQLHSLPLDRPRGTRQTFTGGCFVQQLDAALVEQMGRFCESHSLTPFMLMYSVFGLVLRLYSFERDIVIGTPVAGRSHADVGRTVGMFVNLLVLRSRHAGDSTFAQQLQLDKQGVLAALAHQSVPFEVLIQELQIGGSLAYGPLVQILFAWQSHRDDGLHLPGLDAVAVPRADQPVKFELELEVCPQGPELTLTWRFNVDLFNAQSVAQMAASLVGVLRGALEDADRSPYSLAAGIEPADASALQLSAAERTALVAEAYPRASLPPAATAVPASAKVLRWQVVNPGGGPAPAGALGELCLTLDEQTSMRARSKDLLRTGRLARVAADGTVQLVGRCDRLVRVNGVRIDCSVIERCLVQQALATDAAVLVHEGVRRQQLLAYLVMNESHGPDKSAGMQAACAQAIRDLLPHLALDIQFVLVGEIPRSDDGSADLRTLPMPASEAGVAASPGSEIERQLASIWEALLGTRPASVEDNFFLLGGHSLAAIRLLSAMSRQFGIGEHELSLRDVFENATIAGLARAVAEVRHRSQLQEKQRYLASLDICLEEGAF